ncbi:MAG: 2-hydroxyacid dehydrogenase [Shimia sp.]|nr:2-hydroxyacid dehydrogenase [Shimia sp.]
MRAALSGDFTVHHVDDMENPTAWLEQNGGGIEYVLTDGHYGLRAEYLERLPNLKLISSNGVGYDAINTDDAVSRGVVVTHTPAVLSAEVATTALMLLISCYRQFLPNAAQAQSGRWETEGGLPIARSVDDRTIGILGLGRIGMAIAEKLAPFNARILYHGRNPRDVDYTFYDDLTAMARDSDALICVAPGGAATHHLVNDEVCKALGPDGVLINVGRGSVVDESALITALENGTLGMAGLDVFENEPHIPAALREMPNVVLTPHIGSGTVETRAAMAKLAIDNLLQFKSDGTVLTAVPECASLL